MPPCWNHFSIDAKSGSPFGSFMLPKKSESKPSPDEHVGDIWQENDGTVPSLPATVPIIATANPRPHRP
jgi:hypothetical protein